MEKCYNNNEIANKLDLAKFLYNYVDIVKIVISFSLKIIKFNKQLTEDKF